MSNVVGVTALSRVAEITMGASPKGDTYNREGLGDPLLNGPTEFGAHHPEPSLYTTAGSRFAAAGDLLFCVRGSTTGRMNWADRRYAIGRGLAAIRGDSPNHTAFLGACIESELPTLLASATGATFPNLGKEAVASIPIPDHWNADVVGGIVRTLDTHIENLRRRTELLELMAQAIHREWFVEFRYPGHDEGLPSGAIPPGWEEQPLGELSTNFDRLRKPLSQMQRQQRPGPIPYYGAARLIDSIDDWIFDGEYLLFAEDGSVQTRDGFPVLQLVAGKFWANNHTHILQGSGVSTRFLYLACATRPIRAYVTGAAQPKITQANLKRFPVLVATAPLQRAFDVVVDPIFNERHVLLCTATPLKALRELIVPRLIAGELDVGDIHLDLDQTVA